MKTYTIKQKMSNSGTIHDIASDLYDRDIKFKAGTKYAVVLASYYGDHYTTHKTAEAAIAQSSRTEQSHAIINSDGAQYLECDGKLIMRS